MHRPIQKLGKSHFSSVLRIKNSQLLDEQFNPDRIFPFFIVGCFLKNAYLKISSDFSTECPKYHNQYQCNYICIIYQNQCNITDNRIFRSVYVIIRSFK